jgi:hypothetical protein
MDLLGTMYLAASVLPIAWESSSVHRVAIVGECAPRSGGAGTEHEADSLLFVDA